jgi:hypothetical protein
VHVLYGTVAERVFWKKQKGFSWSMDLRHQHRTAPISFQGNIILGRKLYLFLGVDSKDHFFVFPDQDGPGVVVEVSRQ